MSAQAPARAKAPRRSVPAPRARLAVEIGGRIVAVALATVVLPHVFWGDVDYFRWAARCIGWPDGSTLAACPSKVHLLGGFGTGLNAPYRSVLWEFPPLSLVPLAVEPLSFGSVGAFRLIWGWVMAGFELASLEVLRRAWPDHQRSLTRLWTLSVVPLALLGWFRTDFPAVLFAAVALVAFERRRSTLWPVVAGFAAKLWTAVFVPALVARRRWREAAAVIVVCAACVLAWWAFSPSGFEAFLDYRAGSGLEVGSLPGSLRLLAPDAHVSSVSGAFVVGAGGWTWVDGAMNVALAAYAVGATWRARRPGADHVALLGGLVVALMVFSRILSPQYLTWAAPFVAVLWIRGRRSPGWWYGTASVLTFVGMLFFDPALVADQNAVVVALEVVRNLTVVALLVDLTVRIAPSNKGSPSGVVDPVG